MSQCATELTKSSFGVEIDFIVIDARKKKVPFSKERDTDGVGKMFQNCTQHDENYLSYLKTYFT